MFERGKLFELIEGVGEELPVVKFWVRAKYKIGAFESFRGVTILRAFKNNEDFLKWRLNIFNVILNMLN